MRNEFTNLIKEIISEDPFWNRFNYDPFENLNKRLCSNVLPTNRGEYSQNLPATNVFEDEWSYRFELATPGFTKKDLKIELADNMVNVYGEKKLSNKKDKGEYISKEYHSTKFYRSFALPENVVADEIHAKVENGIATLFLPKVTPTKGKNLSKTIEIA